MRRLAIALGLTISLATLYAYATPKVRRAAHVQLLGFTEQKVTTGFALEAACEDEFPGSRVCTPRDIVRTGDVPQSVANLDPTLPDNWAWIDGTGLEFEGSSLVCHIAVEQGAGFLVTKGAAIAPTGEFGHLRCGTPYRVACCGRPEATRER